MQGQGGGCGPYRADGRHAAFSPAVVRCWARLSSPAVACDGGMQTAGCSLLLCIMPPARLTGSPGASNRCLLLWFPPFKTCCPVAWCRRVRAELDDHPPHGLFQGFYRHAVAAHAGRGLHLYAQRGVHAGASAELTVVCGQARRMKACRMLRLAPPRGLRLATYTPTPSLPRRTSWTLGP